MPPSEPETDPDPNQFQKLMLDDEPDFANLLECVFGITEPVAEVYHQLLARENATAKELAQTLECDQSSVNRKLNTLRTLGLVTRHRDLLSVGGFAYKYESVPLEQVQDLMHETLDEWAAFMHQQIDGVEDTLAPTVQN